MEHKKVHGYELASAGTRLLAQICVTLIFCFIILVGYLILGHSFDEFVSGFFKDTTFLEDSLSNLVIALILGVFYKIYAGNLGHKLFNLKVIHSETGVELKSYGWGALRELLKNLLAYLIIPIIWILWDKNKQNLYDKITKTYVVKKGVRNFEPPLDPPIYKT